MQKGGSIGGSTGVWMLPRRISNAIENEEEKKIRLKRKLARTRDGAHGRWDSREEIVSWERLNYREAYFKGQPFMPRVEEENARLNCRGEEDSRAKWSEVEPDVMPPVVPTPTREGESYFHHLKRFSAPIFDRMSNRVG